jgi:hypothetical protein
MAQAMWHATFFDTLDVRAPAARIEVIHADDEAAAGQLAVARMGRCMRVYVTRPIWGALSLESATIAETSGAGAALA